jgi:uncharacterized protein
MQTVMITGGTGLVGRILAKQLAEKKYHVIILTRKLPANAANSKTITYALWDIANKYIDSTALQQADYIIHLAGAGVMDKAWTDAYRQEIQDSRVKSSQLLVETLQKNNNKIKAVISASAIGWYGEDDAANKKVFTETDPAASGFLGDTCRRWEESIHPVRHMGKRLAIFRTGIVLSNEGGALAEFKKPLQFGVAGILGSGKQMISWIHVDDLCRMFIAAMENEQIAGIYNAVAPLPVSNKTLTLLLAKKIRGRLFIPLHVPTFMLKLLLGGRSIEILKSTTVSCEKIKNTGFVFLYPDIEAALSFLCR